MMRNFGPRAPQDRFEVYRFFNGLSAEAKEGIDRQRTRVPMVKTFLLEHVASRGNRRPTSPQEIFRRLGAELRTIDERFAELTAEVSDADTNSLRHAVTGYVEQYDERFFAYYTCEESNEAKKRVARWVQAPDLDHTWFSSPLLQELWDQDVSKRDENRFGKLTFEHESIFEMLEDFSLPNESAEEELPWSGDDGGDGETEYGAKEDRFEVERRKARFVMGDRISRIKASLHRLQRDYQPLYALHALRIPSRIGRGGHDLYQNGQITNRTDSFEDHRNTVRYLYRIYKSILDVTEDIAWNATRKGQTYQVGSKGVPLIVKFAEPISVAVFNRWIQLAFQKRNRFKLWGNPIRLGPTKVHVYGADRHLWQPINLELTDTGAVAILPGGTCGNTFHRLVANIQQYVSPEIEAWVGGQEFRAVVRQWPVDVEKDDED